MNARVSRAPAGMDAQSAAFGGFAVAAVLVGGVIWFGYYRYALTLRPDWPWGLAVLIGLAVAIAALVLARSAAHARVLGQLEAQAQGRKPSRLLGVQWFLPLLAISALGAMNTLFSILEGDDVVKKRVEIVSAQAHELSLKGQEALRVPAVQKLQADMERLLGDLKLHVVEGDGTGRGNSCGVGRNALETINQIAAIVPGYAQRTLYSQVTACADKRPLEAVYRELEERAWVRFKALPVYTQNSMGKRDDLAKQLQAWPAETSKALTTAMTGSQRLEATRQALRKASTDYAQLKSQIESLSGTPLAGVTPPDIRDAEVLDNAGHVLVNLAKRWTEPTSWLILLAALALDAWLVWAFAQVTRGFVTQAPGAFPGMRVPEETSEDAVIHYLWYDKAA